MRRILLAAMVCFIYFSASLTAIGETVLFGEREEYRYQLPESVCAIGDTLFIRNSDFYCWKPGETEPGLFLAWDENTLPEGWIPSFLYGPVNIGGKPLLLNVSAKTFYEIKREGLFPTRYKADISSLPGSSGDEFDDFRLIYGIVEAEGRIFLLARPSTAEYSAQVLYEADADTGKLTALTDRKDVIMAISPYAPGKLLAAIYGETGSELRILDAQSGTFEAEVFSPAVLDGIEMIAYDAERELIYLVAGNCIYRTRWGGAAEVVNRLDTVYPGGREMSALIDDYIALPSDSGILIRSTDPDKMPKRVLTVSGVWGDEKASMKFRDNHPDIAIDRRDMYFLSIEALTALIAAGEAPDVFAVGAKNFVDALSTKGYAADLSEDSRLMEMAESFYPQIKEVLIKDGKLVGCPLSFNPGLWMYDAAAFQELGLGAFPETMDAFIELVARWESEYAGEHPDKELFFFGRDTKDGLFDMIFSYYVALNETKDAPLSFDTPKFRALMGKLEETPLSSPATALSQDPSGDRHSLIDQYADLHNYAGAYALTLPPRLSEADAPMAIGSIDLLIVNPGTENRDAALEYLRLTADEMSSNLRYLMTPTLNEPVESKFYETQKLNFAKYYEEEKAKEVAPHEQKDHEALLCELEQYLNVGIEELRWDISPETLGTYRELAPHIIIPTSSLLYNVGIAGEFAGIAHRYMQGQLTLDQFIRELDQKAEMIYLETR